MGDDSRTDGGVVETSASGSPGSTPIDRLRRNADDGRLVVGAMAVGLIVFPFFLVEVMGVLSETAVTVLQIPAILLLVGGLLAMIANNFVGAERLFTAGLAAFVLGLFVGVLSIETSLGGYEGLASLVLAFGIAVVGFNILLGYVGLLSFGHAAFFGTSAYAAGIVASEATIQIPVVNASVTMPGLTSPLLMILVGIVVATILSWPIGFLSIRRSGVYFAVLTLTFGQMLYFYALAPGSWLTQGDNGFGTGSTGFSPGALFGQFSLEATSPIPASSWIYVLAALITLLAVALAYRIIKSPYGLIFKALGENEQRVEFVGLNVFRYKLMAFIISAAFTGAGGALFAIHETYLHPTTALFWITSGDFVIMNILGGVGTLAGPLFGALLFEYIGNVVSGASFPVIGSVGSLWRLVLGGVFVIIVWLFPDGVWGGIRASVVGVVRTVERYVFDVEDRAVPEDVEDTRRGDD